MKATEGASPTRPSPPTLSPNPTPPLFASRVSSFGLNDSWKVCGLGFSGSWVIKVQGLMIPGDIGIPVLQILGGKDVIP